MATIRTLQKKGRLRFDWILAFCATIAAILLHVIFLTHAGGLWRDEAGFVRLATLPSWHDVWRMLGHDHCPILLPAIVRMWCAAGWGKTDFGLRILGLIVGLLLLAMFWVASRMMRRGVPLLPLALVALNITIIRSGDSLRGYGLGSALIVLVLALIWRGVQKPTSVNVLLGALAALLSVQCLYQNAFFVFAAVCGGIVVCIRERRWRDTLWLLGIGALAAASLVPYVRIILGAQEWYILEKSGFYFSLGWESFSTAVGFQSLGFSWLWMALCLSAIWISFSVVSLHAQPASVVAHRNLILFGTVALVVGVAGFVVFLTIANLPTPPWYYTPLMVFVAVCLDAILPGCHRWAQPALTAFAALTTSATFLFGIPALECRQTNVDVIAARLIKEVAPNDYIIVNPWYLGVSFERYYKGAAPWTTLPPLEDHSLHRYDLFKAKMQVKNPIQPILDKIASTLQTSNRVWIVGFIPPSQTPPPDSNPAPNNPWGWLEKPYSQIWTAKVGYFIVSHANQGAVVTIPSGRCVNAFEDLPVVWIAGWRSPSLLITPQ
jgi:hypothetical protein